MESSTLWLSFLFGTFGMGYLVYGRKQRRVMPVVSGLALMAVPYAFDNPWIVSAVCVAMMGLPFVVAI